MGSHHTKSGDVSPSETTKNKQMSQTPSNQDLQQQQQQQQDDGANKPSELMPLERLAKILSDKAHAEEGCHGITLTVFTKYLFPRYQILAERLFHYLNSGIETKKQSKSSTPMMSKHAFKQQCEKYLSILEDDVIRETFVRMFATLNQTTCENVTTTDQGQEQLIMTPDNLRSLLMCAYHVSMDHYSEGPQMCLSIQKTLSSIVSSCFHTKTQLSTQFVAHWMQANCPRLILPLHRYAIHSLATSYRTLEALDQSQTDSEPSQGAGLELSTPVIEQAPPIYPNSKDCGDGAGLGRGNSTKSKNGNSKHLLQMSMSWLLAGALHPIYSRPQKASTSSSSPNNSSVSLSTQHAVFLSKLLCSVPSHWVVLYDSNDMGLGANRFLHHVIAYRGPTLCLLQSEDGQIFCIASPNEWKESHLYWGSEEAAVFQMMPKFALLEKGSKLLYLNTTIRGYPHGLRAGKDPRKPTIIVDGGFEKMEFKKIPYDLVRIEVWGCGDQVSREKQLEIKKWEVKEAERQRNVKLSAADWLDHPDRYLLELAGRPQYHQSQPQ